MDDDSPQEHDPTEATVEEVAEFCGIGHELVPADRVPLEQYRQTGTVTCDECGAEPDPPTRAVAVFGGEVLCHECAAADLGAGIDPNEARALVLHHFGWGPDDIGQDPLIAESEADPSELLKRAQLKLD